MHAKINNDANELKSSNFDQLEHYIHDTLDSGESLRLKLESPLSVGAVLAKYVPGALQRWWFPPPYKVWRRYGHALQRLWFPPPYKV